VENKKGGGLGRGVKELEFEEKIDTESAHWVGKKNITLQKPPSLGRVKKGGGIR